MAETLWCRHDGCDYSFFCVAGVKPEKCPGCSRQAAWSKFEPSPPYRLPTKAYDLTPKDRAFLKANRILVDGKKSV